MKTTDPRSRVPSSHHYLSHTGEIRLHLQASTLPELLAEAGRALSDLLIRESNGFPLGAWQEVEVRATDREGLLVEWLNELIYRAETELMVATEFEFQEIQDTRVRARVRGILVPIPPTLVKAATYHGIQISPSVNGLEADVILDV